MVCLYLNRIKTLQFYSSVFSLMQTFLLGVLDLYILSRCSWHNSKLPYCTSPSHTAVQHPHSQILLLTVPVSRYFFHQNRDQLLFGVITATSQQQFQHPYPHFQVLHLPKLLFLNSITLLASKNGVNKSINTYNRMSIDKSIIQVRLKSCKCIMQVHQKTLHIGFDKQINV